MSWLSRLFRRGEQDARLDSELRFHLEQQTADNLAAGRPPGEARRLALAQFGGLEYIKEEARDARGTRFLDALFQDIRFAFRILRKTPLVTGIAIVSLALGIGANTAIFSLVDAVMLRRLPVRNPEQLTQILFRARTFSRPGSNFTNPIWEQVRDHQDVFDGVFAWRATNFDLASGGEQENVRGVYVSGSYFATLGVRPAAGRLLAASDDVRGCSGVAVLGYGFWQQHYDGSESAIGSLIRLNDRAFPIVGVAQNGFFGTDIGTSLDVAIPICAQAILAGQDSALDVRTDWWLSVMGRLKPGMSVEQAEARMKVLAPPIFGAVVPQEWPSSRQDAFRKYTFAVLPAAGGADGPFGLRAYYGRPLGILMSVVGLVLLIACANIASLLLARSAARQKEIAVRLSLGASRPRLIRQFLTESVVLSGVGALGGVFFARWGGALLVRFVSTQQNQVFLDVRMDGRVLGFTIAIAVLCGLLFGILPAFRATRVSAMSAMKEGQSPGAGGRSPSVAARSIVAAQVALSLVLLVGTGLFLRTFTNLMALNAGFDRHNVLLVNTNIHNAQIREPARAALYGQMLAKLQALPGVVSASQCWIMPLSRLEWDNSLAIPGGSVPAAANPDILMNWVTPDFFATMRTPILEGRAFGARDTAASAPVVIVNQLLARTYFPGQDPIGQHLVAHDREVLGTQPKTIIGVAQDAKYISLRDDFQPEAYFPLKQIGGVDEETAFEVRTAMTAGALIPAVREAMAGVNKSASLQFTTLKQEAHDSAVQEHLMAVLSGFFGGLALLLTAVGLYGVMAYIVTLRTHEIGVRVALGAPRSAILRLVLRDAAVVLAAGVVAGSLGSLWITRLVRQLLFGLRPNDPSTLLLAIAVLAAVALVATYIPARRALKVDPLVALRYE